ncbi:hypothetical protein JHK86_055371 [Glycine max]|nr:hypothetical protein JHK86_055371 [Glycine max]
MRRSLPSPAPPPTRTSPPRNVAPGGFGALCSSKKTASTAARSTSFILLLVYSTLFFFYSFLLFHKSFVAKSVAREDGIRECATTVRAANSNVLSGIGFSRPVFHHDGSKGGGGSGNISALLTGVPRDVNKQLLHVTSGMTFSSKTIGGNLNSKVKSAVMKGSTLMKPTASLLAKQNQPHPIVSSR